MILPASFLKDGYVPMNQIKRRLMIGTDGPPDSGKSEFALSAPGPGLWICLDRGLALLDNPNPPPARNSQFACKVVEVPLATQMSQPGYLDYWKSFYNQFKTALDNRDALTIVLDGDSDSWELQRLAEFGRLSKVPSNMYDNVNAARRAMYARAWDSGKIVIATNRLRKVYVPKLRPDGQPEISQSGSEVRVWNGLYERQGFADQEYLWQIQLRHFYDATKHEWGVKIMKCKPDPSLVGLDLKGGDCNFAGLVQTVYPHVSLKEWGL